MNASGDMEGSGHTFQSPPLRRILIVEDDAVVRRKCHSALTQLNIEADSAADGQEGWKSLTEKVYQLLVTDNDLPEITGVELICRARLEGLRIPVILMSGSTMAERLCRLAGLRGCVFLLKPFTPEHLAKIVQTVLADFEADPQRFLSSDCSAP